MRPIAVLAALALWLPACASFVVGGGPEPGAEFGAYGTYAWIPLSELPPPDPMAQNEQVALWMRQVLGEELAARGYRQDDAAPDLRLSLRVGITDRLGATVWGYGYGGRGIAGAYLLPGNYRQAILLLEGTDARTRADVLRVTAEGDVPTGDDREDRLREVLRDMAGRFPAR